MLGMNPLWLMGVPKPALGPGLSYCLMWARLCHTDFSNFTFIGFNHLSLRGLCVLCLFKRSCPTGGRK